MAFRGFPDEAITFYERLEADNSKTYWTAHKDVYERAVKEPMEALCAELDGEFGPLRMFRPYRDVRFSKDKAPYKTAAAAFGESEDGGNYYLHLSAEGLFVGSGYYHMAPDQLVRFREAVDDEKHRHRDRRVAAAMEKAGYDMAAHESLKTAPTRVRQGPPADRAAPPQGPRGGQAAGRSPSGCTPTETKKRIVKAWRDCAPLNRWLSDNVGPSELPPDERGRPLTRATSRGRCSVPRPGVIVTIQPPSPLSAVCHTPGGLISAWPGPISTVTVLPSTSCRNRCVPVHAITTSAPAGWRSHVVHAPAMCDMITIRPSGPSSRVARS